MFTVCKSHEMRNNLYFLGINLHYREKVIKTPVKLHSAIIVLSNFEYYIISISFQKKTEK